MRNKLKELMGKKLEVQCGEHITSPRFEDISYDEIIEVGDDYFVVKKVRKIEPSRGRGREARKEYPITYAISEVKSIKGGI
ncbi:MAG TPA: hypothetical protein DDY52_04430 [Candidatus Moranbacteria bacterium]|nr:hypothetical protein [Candidatus Moranbacteria bacterium]